MHRKNLIEQLTRYRASSTITLEEKPMLEQFVEFITGNEGCFERSNAGHVTGSVWIVSHDHSHVLLTHHKKLNMWLQLGGHADGDPDILAVALKEAQEESGIDEFEVLTQEIFDIDIHALPNACQYHYDVRFLLRAPEGSQIQLSHESHALAWIPVGKLRDYTNEQSVLRMLDKVTFPV